MKQIPENNDTFIVEKEQQHDDGGSDEGASAEGGQEGGGGLGSQPFEELGPSSLAARQAPQEAAAVAPSIPSVNIVEVTTLDEVLEEQAMDKAERTHQSTRAYRNAKRPTGFKCSYINGGLLE